MKLLQIFILTSASVSVGAITRNMLRGSSAKTLARPLTWMRILEDYEDPDVNDDDTYFVEDDADDDDEDNDEDDDEYGDEYGDDDDDAAANDRKLEDNEDPTEDDDDTYFSEDVDAETSDRHL
mmetsp:Transcript_35071/g.41858  ORF Transcript_35071/g.41858 Transcript_35071/m.41858 type:complete len:123 (+) Transcript_35071:91-459(+)